MMRKLILLAAFLCCVQTLAFAEERPPVTAALHVDGNALHASQPTWIGIELQMDKGWHSYWKNPGDVGYPTTITWTLPSEYTVSDIYWPYPEKETSETGTVFHYGDRVMLLAQVTPPTHAGDSVEVEAKVEWLACSESTCLPGETTLSLNVPVTDEVSPSDSRFSKALQALPEQKQLSVHRNRDRIQVEVPPEAHSATSVYFCPENDTLVENAHTGEWKKGHLILNVSESAPKSGVLKGTLVAKTGSKTFAWAVEHPVQYSSDIAMVDDVSAPHASHFSGGILWALVFAFIGGLILNLMPCVLPVISIKIFGFIKMAGESRFKILKHGLAFSFGVLLSFWVLAGLLLALKAYGHSVGWGFQLQEPIFVAVLAAIIFIFGMSLFGVFELGTGFATTAGKAHTESTKYGSELFGSFMSGILATTVATPCTGPFLGSAVGFAVTLPALASLLIFTFLGLGMAFPYLLVAAYPKALSIFPKPGPWMVIFKEVMGFFMVLTTIWLLWVFAAQVGNLALFKVLFSFLLFAVACWIYGKWGSPVQVKRVRYFGYLWTAAFFLLGSGAIYDATWGTQETIVAAHDDEWEAFSQIKLDQLTKAGKPVFVDFTAKWCLICQANHAVLSTPKVADQFKQLDVVKMKADWTKRDADITSALMKYGRNSVPLYLLYGTRPGEVYVLPQVLTPDVVLQYINQLNQNA